MGRPPKTTPDALLDAAEAVVLEQGAGRLTLDAVAARAGVTKGGVVTAFPSKEALLRGMVERFLRRLDAELAAADPAALHDPLREVAALIRLLRGDAPADAPGGHGDAPADGDASFAAAVAAAAAQDPSLLAPVRGWMRARYARLDALGPLAADASLLLLALDGLWTLELDGIGPFDAAARRAFLDDAGVRAAALLASRDGEEG